MSFLKDANSQSAAAVSRSFKKSVIDSEKLYKDDYSLLINLAKFFAENLPGDYQKEKRNLLDFRKQIMKSENLNQIRFLVRNGKGTIANILKEVKYEDLEILEQRLNKKDNLKLAENIFDLVEFYKRMDIVVWNCMLSSFCWLENLGSNFEDYSREKLVGNEFFDETIELAEEIDEGYWKKAIFNSINKESGKSSHEFRIGNFDAAIEIAKVIEAENEGGYSNTFTTICKELAKNGNFEKVWEVAKQLDSFSDRIDALKTISKELAKSGDFDKALAFAEKIDEAKEKAAFCRHISKELAKSGDFDRALEIAEKIDNAKWRDIAFETLSRELAKSGDFDKAFKIVEKIGDSYLKDAANSTAISY